jgi:hypothetical protein
MGWSNSARGHRIQLQARGGGRRQRALEGRQTGQWREGGEGPVAEMAARCGTDGATYTRERPGMSVFALEHRAPPRAQRDRRLVAPPR